MKRILNEMNEKTVFLVGCVFNQTICLALMPRSVPMCNWFQINTNKREQLIAFSNHLLAARHKAVRYVLTHCIKNLEHFDVVISNYQPQIILAVSLDFISYIWNTTCASMTLFRSKTSQRILTIDIDIDFQWFHGSNIDKNKLNGNNKNNEQIFAFRQQQQQQQEGRKILTRRILAILQYQHYWRLFFHLFASIIKKIVSLTYFLRFMRLKNPCIINYHCIINHFNNIFLVAENKKNDKKINVPNN